MNEVAYFKIRARHFSERALETLDPSLKAIYGAIAIDMMAKLKTADRSRNVILVGGVVVDPSEAPVQPWLADAD
jgi:hypothetical protein